MARPKSYFVKAMGTGWEIFLAIVNEVLSLGGNDEHLRRILTSKTLRWQIAMLIVGSVKKITSLTEMIVLGKYDWVDENITEVNFPMPENFVLGTEPKLYHFNRSISSEDAIKEIEKDGFRPARIWDLLDYGAKNPELQIQFPIVALGSVAQVGGSRRVACLDMGNAGRGLDLYWFEDDWRGIARFLAVRN